MHGVLEDNAPENTSLIQSLTDPTALLSAVAAATGLSSVSLAGSVQDGSQALYHFLIDLSCATISGDLTLRDLIAAAVKDDANAGRARFKA